MRPFPFVVGGRRDVGALFRSMRLALRPLTVSLTEDRCWPGGRNSFYSSRPLALHSWCLQTFSFNSGVSTLKQAHACADLPRHKRTYICAFGLAAFTLPFTPPVVWYALRIVATTAYRQLRCLVACFLVVLYWNECFTVSRNMHPGPLSSRFVPCSPFHALWHFLRVAHILSVPHLQTKKEKKNEVRECRFAGVLELKITWGVHKHYAANYTFRYIPIIYLS